MVMEGFHTAQSFILITRLVTPQAQDTATQVSLDTSTPGMTLKTMSILIILTPQAGGAPISNIDHL